jgi:hypothetical protein
MNIAANHGAIRSQSHRLRDAKDSHWLARVEKTKGKIMKKKLVQAGMITGLALGLWSSAFAAGDEITITGEGACAKCILKEKGVTDHLKTITVKKADRKQIYYLVENDIAKKFGDQLCKEPKKIKAIGTVEVVDGKLELTPSKIHLVEDDAVLQPMPRAVPK